MLAATRTPEIEFSPNSSRGKNDSGGGCGGGCGGRGEGTGDSEGDAANHNATIGGGDLSSMRGG